MPASIPETTGPFDDPGAGIGGFITSAERALLMIGHGGNIAFKCTYNNGGERGFVGFGGTCSNENIFRNVKTNPRRWCSSPSNLCQRFCENGFRGKRPHHPCYESEIIDRWRFGPGTYQSRNRDGKPIPMKHAQVGKVALLTTRHPERDTERERIVFGVYKIERVRRDDCGQIWIEGSADHAIRLSESAAFALPYWNFKKLAPDDEPDWRTGLFRYISDQELTNFLHPLYRRLQSAQDRTVLEELLECSGNLDPELAPGEVNGDVPESDLKQKYGPGGEGERHKVLKQFIADNPERLGLGRGKGAVEHRFVTGDRVDVSIALADGEHCVVEIEVEGESTSIGAHQALKYRALRASELDSTELPHACLVVYSIPQHVKDFCERHGVSALEIQPD